MNRYHKNKEGSLATGKSALAFGLLASMMFSPTELFSRGQGLGTQTSPDNEPKAGRFVEKETRCNITKTPEALEVLRVLNISWVEREFGIKLIFENRCIDGKCMGLVFGTKDKPLRTVQLSGNAKKEELYVLAIPEQGVSKTTVIDRKGAGRNK